MFWIMALVLSKFFSQKSFKNLVTQSAIFENETAIRDLQKFQIICLTDLFGN